MEKIRLTTDFREFLQLLNSEPIEYLLIGGYAVGLYGHVRPTKDMDVWVSIASTNIAGIIDVLVKFGFSRESIVEPIFDNVKTNLRIGVPPNQLEIISRIGGVDFAECFPRRVLMDLDGVVVPVISFEDLRKNKLSTGRAQDLADVQKLDRRSGKTK